MASQQVSDGSTSYSMKPGFQGGVYVTYSLAKMIIQADVVYVQQGADIDNQGQKLSTTFSYVNVPIVARYAFVESFNVQLGPQIGFLSCAKSDYNPVTQQPYAEQNYTKAYKPVDIGINIGAGFTPPASRFSADLRFYLGLTDISDFPGVAETRNRVLNLNVSYRLIDF